MSGRIATALHTFPRAPAPRETALLICAGITTSKGIKEIEARPGERIAISGCGALGHLAIQYATATGMLVCGIDIEDGSPAQTKTAPRERGRGSLGAGTGFEPVTFRL